MTELQTVVLLSLLLGLQPITTDLYLPALPGITASLEASVAQAQQTLAAMLFAFGVAQLFWGPLSDRFGRKPILLAGLSLYVAAALGCTFATSMPQLLGWRVVQGVALGASVMAGRAIVRDLHDPLAGAKLLSRAFSGLGLLACLSPLVGGATVYALGWRATLFVLAVAGAITLAFTWCIFRETLARRNPHALRPAALLRAWREVLGHRDFWIFTLLASSSYGGLFTFLASSSFIFINLYRFSPTEYSLVMLASAASYLFGTVLCRRLLGRFGLRRTVQLGGVLSCAAGGLMVILLLGRGGPMGLLLPFCGFMIAHGIHQPCGQSGAVGAFPQSAGVASALSGFVMMSIAFLTGAVLGVVMRDNPWPFAGLVAFWGAMLFVLAFAFVPRSRLVASEAVQTERAG
ncbi:MAG: multidrug effflux MFS transporter [Rhodocyclales bacterium]|nr:multidrug effflux MFS transporter [Rhodocyclales bacterium]